MPEKLELPAIVSTAQPSTAQLSHTNQLCHATPPNHPQGEWWSDWSQMNKVTNTTSPPLPSFTQIYTHTLINNLFVFPHTQQDTGPLPSPLQDMSCSPPSTPSPPPLHHLPAARLPAGLDICISIGRWLPNCSKTHITATLKSN